MEISTQNVVTLFQFSIPGLPSISLGIPPEQVLEVSRLGAVMPVPIVPAFVLGITLWRDTPITVINLAKLLCGDAMHTEDSNTHFVIARVLLNDKAEVISWPILRGASFVALPAQLPQSDIPQEIQHQFVAAVLDVDGNALTVLDLTTFEAHTFPPQGKEPLA